jgi:hypothetical protein
VGCLRRRITTVELPVGTEVGEGSPDQTLGFPLRFRCGPTIFAVGCLRRRTFTVGGLRCGATTVTAELGTEVGDSDIGLRLRRRATTVDLPLGTEVGDTGRRLGCLVDFLLGGYVAL